MREAPAVRRLEERTRRLIEDPQENPTEDLALDSALGPSTTPGELDAFISYARRDDQTAYVDRLCADLEQRGKSVWVDRTNIEPAAQWRTRIARGIESAKSFIFVISPESISSIECRRELDAAIEHHKRIIPVVYKSVLDADVPMSLRDFNWIFARPVDTTEDQNGRPLPLADEYDTGLSALIDALESDLQWRDMHARLATRTREWRDSNRERGYLLHGADLSAAEDWYGKKGDHKEQPTDAQYEFIRESRNGANRRQRIAFGAISLALVIAVVLAVVAVVQRNQARHEAIVARARALAAESTAQLSTNPQQSLRLAAEAEKLNPSSTAESALRLSLAQSRMRLAIRTGSGGPTTNSPGTVAAWNPRNSEVALSAPGGALDLWNPLTAKLITKIATGGPVASVAFDPTGRYLATTSRSAGIAVFTSAGKPVNISPLEEVVYGATSPSKAVDASGLTWIPGTTPKLLVPTGNLYTFEPGNGLAQEILIAHGEFLAGTVVPSPNGAQIWFDGIGAGPGVLTLATNQVTIYPPAAVSSANPPPPPFHTGLEAGCWEDDSTIATWDMGNGDDLVRLFNAQTGEQLASLSTGNPFDTVACSGSDSNPWIVAGDRSGNVLLRHADGTTLNLSGHSQSIEAIAVSANGQLIGTASADNTARIWQVSNGALVSVLNGYTASLNVIGFSPDATLALTVDAKGSVRIWDTGIGHPMVTLQHPPTGRTNELGFVADGQLIYGLHSEFSNPNSSNAGFHASLLIWQAHTGRLRYSIPLPSGDHATPIECTDTNSVTAVAGDCLAPPPSLVNVLSTTPADALPFQPSQNGGLKTVLASVSADGKYAAYTDRRHLIIRRIGGGILSTLGLPDIPTGLSLSASGDTVLVMTRGAIELWQPGSRGRPVVVQQATPPLDAEFSANGARIAVVDEGGTAGVWTTAGQKVATLHTPQRTIPLSTALNRDGSVIAVSTNSGSVLVSNVHSPHPRFGWDFRMGDIGFENLGATLSYPVVSLSFAPHGARLLAINLPSSADGSTRLPVTAEVLDVRTRRPIAQFRSPAVFVGSPRSGASLSPYGNALLAGLMGLAPTSANGHEAIYDVGDGETSLNLQSIELPQTFTPFPVNPWSSEGIHVLAGNGAIYACDACGSAAQMLSNAESHISWFQPIPLQSGRRGQGSPYG